MNTWQSLVSRTGSNRAIRSEKARPAHVNYQIWIGTKNERIQIALEVILKALRYKAVKGDVKAATLLLERAYGKPKQFIEQINTNQIDLKSLSDEELFLVKKIQEKKKPNESDNGDSLS